MYMYVHNYVNSNNNVHAHIYMYMSTVTMYIHVYPKNGMGEFGLGVSAGKLLNVWPTMHCPCLQGITYTADNENTSESVYTPVPWT